MATETLWDNRRTLIVPFRPQSPPSPTPLQTTILCLSPFLRRIYPAACTRPSPPAPVCRPRSGTPWKRRGFDTRTPCAEVPCAGVPQASRLTAHLKRPSSLSDDRGVTTSSTFPHALSSNVSRMGVAPNIRATSPSSFDRGRSGP